MASSESLELRFFGPLTFAPGDRSLFASPHAEYSCVYLWTLWSERKNLHFIHYVGESSCFAKRHREHLASILGLEYGIWDVEAARAGVSTMLWPGTWRDRSPEGPARAITEYPRLCASVSAYVQYLTVFVARVRDDSALRKHVEGSLARYVKNAPGEVNTFYPPDNRADPRREPLGVQLQVSADAPIAGLPAQLIV